MISHTASTSRAAWSLPLLRVAPGTQALLTLQSDAALYFELHWLDKNYVCPGDGCPACADHLARMKGYFIATVDTPQGQLPCLVEAVPSAIQRMIDQLTMERLTFGGGVTLMAFRKSANRPINFNLEGDGGSVDPTLRSDHRTLAAAAVLFGLPLPQREETTVDYALRADLVARNLLINAMRQV